MPWDDLHNDVADEFAEFEQVNEDDVERGIEIVRTAASEKRQVQRAILAVKDPTYLERKRQYARESAARRRERDRKSTRPARPTPAHILDVVAEKFGMTVDEVKAGDGRRGSGKVSPRRLAMFLMRQLTLASTVEIARFVGITSHTSVIHAHRDIKKLCETDANVRQVVETLTNDAMGVDGVGCACASCDRFKLERDKAIAEAKALKDELRILRAGLEGLRARRGDCGD